MHTETRQSSNPTPAQPPPPPANSPPKQAHYGSTPVSAPKKPVLFLGRMRRGFSSLVVKLEGPRTPVRNRRRDPATAAKPQATEPKNGGGRWESNPPSKASRLASTGFENRGLHQDSDARQSGLLTRSWRHHEENLSRIRSATTY